ncbi:MAG: hypothetical protein K9L98_00075 [Candidatus Pacebacteria bacterium]|nr:hypothetical protein [Candidatus Paceibacterota bacterium]MCF7862400.1 hypothetical protein [Candidatus Paceibacterota bacterium]
MNIFKKISIILIISFCFLGVQTNAQMSEADVILNILPSNPAPNQNIKAFITSRFIDLNKSLIIWSIDGQNVATGIGKKEISFNSGNIGNVTNISASVETIGGASIQKTLSVRTLEIDLLWEAPSSYVPPFYKGKKLAVNQAELKVVALPSFGSGNSATLLKNLSYTWSLAGSIQPQNSGWGKNFMIFTPSYLDFENEILVKASDINNTTRVENTILVPTYNTKILFYEKDRKLGVKWDNAISDNFFINPEGSILIVEPYFFSIKDSDLKDPNLLINWFINGNTASTSENKNILSVKPEQQEGEALIKVHIENSKTLFQEREKNLKVVF